MLIVLFDLLFHRTAHLVAGVGPLWRLEVALWALLQTLAVWLAISTALLLGN